jgi:hypothetical protein
MGGRWYQKIDRIRLLRRARRAETALGLIKMMCVPAIGAPQRDHHADL